MPISEGGEWRGEGRGGERQRNEGIEWGRRINLGKMWGTEIKRTRRRKIKQENIARVRYNVYQ